MGNVLVGLAGSFGSGCTTVAKMLGEAGDCHVVCLSDEIKREAESKGVEPTRANLQALGNELRQTQGLHVLAERAVTAAHEEAPDENWVLDGIRNLGEVAWLRSEMKNFYLLAVDAARSTRWERVRDRYEKNEAKFEDDDGRDSEEPYEYGQQVAACVDAADVLLRNETNIFESKTVEAEVAQKLRDYLDLLKQPGSRPPSPEELLMHIAYSTSLRSSCLRRKVGAVIAAPFPANGSRQAQDTGYAVVATGYNEVPRGQQPCRDKHQRCYRDIRRREQAEALKDLLCACGSPLKGAVRCPKCDRDWGVLRDDDKGLEYCRALHAEETAILQVTRTGGASLRGTVLYTTTFPCLLCAKKIVHAGMNKVVYVEPYPMPQAATFLRDAGVTTARFEGVKAQAFYKLFYDLPSAW